MTRLALTRMALSAALVLSIPVTVSGQDATEAPEGVEWHLAGYAVEGEIGIVPWNVDATLCSRTESPAATRAATGSAAATRLTATAWSSTRP